MPNLISLSFDLIFGLLPPAGWDALRGWVTTVGGIVAVLIALRTYRLNARLKNEEQARQVYSEMQRVRGGRAGRRFDRSRFDAAIHKDLGVWQRDERGAVFLEPVTDWVSYRLILNNTSSELIGPAYITSVYAYTGSSSRVVVAFMDALKPESSYLKVAYVPMDEGGVAPKPKISIAFRDSAGRWWKRTGTDPIRPSTDPQKSREWRAYLKSQDEPILRDQIPRGPNVREPDIDDDE